MKKIVCICIAATLLGSCKKKDLAEELGCGTIKFDNLEIVEDVYKRYSITIPKGWKTNLYYDTNQSSIYCADTTKQLKETYILDVNWISMPVNFDDQFLTKYNQSVRNSRLIVDSAYPTTFLEKEAYFSRVIGKKNNFSYEQISLYVKLNRREHMYIRAEVYGDSLRNERLCKAVQLIDKIKLKQ